MNNIAKWNGRNWSGLGSGVNDNVYALAHDGTGNLYAGGAFTTTGDKVSHYIGWWNLPIKVVKTATPKTLLEPGGQVTFHITVYNTSSTNRDITITGLSDNIHGDLNGQGNCETPQTITQSNSYSCFFNAEVKGAAWHFETDVVTAEGADDLGENVTASDDATVTIIREGMLDDGLMCFPVSAKNGNIVLICM